MPSCIHFPPLTQRYCWKTISAGLSHFRISCKQNTDKFGSWVSLQEHLCSDQIWEIETGTPLQSRGKVHLLSSIIKIVSPSDKSCSAWLVTPWTMRVPNLHGSLLWHEPTGPLCTATEGLGGQGKPLQQSSSRFLLVVKNKILILSLGDLVSSASPSVTLAG